MNLLVFAHRPPPVHGQSLMVAALVDGLRRDAGIRVLHVDARLSARSTDIGKWEAAKVLRVLLACCRAWRFRMQAGDAVLYYVPAPGKRGALYRDLVVMALCRPWFSRLVLHWHATGLADWLERHGNGWERRLAHAALDGADLSIVLSSTLARDASHFHARRIVTVRNGVADPVAAVPAAAPPTATGRRRWQVLFLGLCSRDKGIFDVLHAVVSANRRQPDPAFELTVAGAFADPEEEAAFRRRLDDVPAGTARLVGFADVTLKDQLFRAADVFCLPSSYPHEGQPLALIEAMAYDLPIVASRWRGIPEMMPPTHAWLVPPGDQTALADALLEARRAGAPRGAVRAHFLTHFTLERHLDAMKAALADVGVLPAPGAGTINRRQGATGSGG